MSWASVARAGISGLETEIDDSAAPSKHVGHTRDSQEAGNSNPPAELKGRKNFKKSKHQGKKSNEARDGSLEGESERHPLSNSSGSTGDKNHSGDDISSHFTSKRLVRKGSNRSINSDTNSADRNSQEVSSVLFSLANVKYFVDMKKNSDGHFLKLTQVESGAGAGSRTRLVIPLQAANEMPVLLVEFITFVTTMPVQSVLPATDEVVVKGETVSAPQRQFRMELFDNPAGRFFRIVCYLMKPNGGSQMSRGIIQMHSAGLAFLMEAITHALNAHSGRLVLSDSGNFQLVDSAITARQLRRQHSSENASGDTSSVATWCTDSQTGAGYLGSAPATPSLVPESPKLVEQDGEYNAETLSKQSQFPL